MTRNENPSRARHDDEISLVDLASTFLRRRRVFYVVFVVTVLAGLGWALLTPAKFEYISLVKVAEKYSAKDSVKYLDEPSSLIAEFESHWWQEIQAAYWSKHEERLPFEVNFVNPDGTGLIQILTEAPESEANIVERVHGELTGGLEKSQGIAVSNLRKKLERRIESLNATVEMLKGAEDAGASMASAIEQLASLEHELASIEPAELLVVSRQSSEPVGPPKSLIVALASLLGLIAGTLLAFFTEFAALVRDQMAEA